MAHDLCCIRICTDMTNTRVKIEPLKLCSRHAMSAFENSVSFISFYSWPLSTLLCVDFFSLYSFGSLGPTTQLPNKCIHGDILTYYYLKLPRFSLACFLPVFLKLSHLPFASFYISISFFSPSYSV